MSVTLDHEQHKQERSRHTAACIVQAAHQLFSEHGTKVSLRDIAERAGVSPSTLSERFPTRRKLISAVLDHDFANERAEFEETAATAFKEALRLGVTSLLPIIRSVSIMYIRRLVARTTLIHALSHETGLIEEVTRRRTQLVKKNRATLMHLLKVLLGARFTTELERRVSVAAHILHGTGVTIAREQEIAAVYDGVGEDEIITRIVDLALGHIQELLETS